MNETMTVKELADVAKVSRQTIYRAINSLNYDMKNGKAAAFDHEQCIKIIAALKSRPVHAGQVAVQNGQGRQGDAVQRQDVAVQPEIVKAFTDAIQVMNKVAEACFEANRATREMLNQRAIPAPQSQYQTVKSYCITRRLPLDREQAIRYGKAAKALSEQRGISIFERPDETYGKLNAYHVTILAEVIGQ